MRPYLSPIMEIFGCWPKVFFLGENGPLGRFPFFWAQLLKHCHVILLCIILLCIHICSVNDENPHIKNWTKIWDTTRSQQSHEELISQRLWPTSVMEWMVHNRAPTEAKNSKKFYSVPVESTQSYSIRSHRSMDGYYAGLDGPQAAWACRKYHGHRTLPPEALWEARAHAWIGY